MNQSTDWKDRIEILLHDAESLDETVAKTIEDIEKITGELHQETSKNFENAQTQLK